MPFLNWTRATLSLSFAEFESASQQPGRHLTLELAAAERAVLHAELGPVLRESGELRLDLPQGWTLFWKKREGESRMLLAHPEAESWVGSVSMSVEAVEGFLAALADLTAADPGLDLGVHLSASATGNLGLTLRLR